MYQELNLELILHTLDTLRHRIEERFPDSGLSRVAGDLYSFGQETGPLLDRLRRPDPWIRTGVGVAVVVILTLAGALVVFLPTLTLEVEGIGAFLQAVESAAQDLIFLSLALYFLLTLESRIRRRASLQALHRVRSIVHIVDMHQLTKDPEHLLSPGRPTASSPRRKLTRFQLARYLDYCSELLSIASKLAALHAQHRQDPVVVDAVHDIEVLASHLSNKIWQKIVIVDTAPGRPASCRPREARARRRPTSRDD